MVKTLKGIKEKAKNQKNIRVLFQHPRNSSRKGRIGKGMKVIIIFDAKGSREKTRLPR